MITRSELYTRGLDLINEFCNKNQLIVPTIVLIDKDDWLFSVPAYYRKETGIVICIDKCSKCCTDSQLRNWNWPGNKTDKTPYGVLAHELGHHVDYHIGKNKGNYWSEYSSEVRSKSGEKFLTSYGDDDIEWFAEMFRLFLTNHMLLFLIRPKTYAVLREKFIPVSNTCIWESMLFPPPKKIISNLNKLIEGEKK